MSIELAPVEARVLGCLAEKELATPEYYPLTLNALTNACNQKSNRDPVMALDDNQVQDALDSLRKNQLALLSSEGVRTARFAHNLRGLLHLEADELAVMTELLLRGPQTVGELRNRAERMHPFADLTAVTEVLQELADRSPPLVTLLPRQTGRKESRYTQLLTPPEEHTADCSGTETSTPEDISRHAVANEVEKLREELAQLREEFETFKQQFE